METLIWGNSELYCRSIGWMINIVTGSAKLGVNVPELNRRFRNYIFDGAGPCFPCSLVFDVDVMSVALNTDNLVSRSPLQIPFAWLFVLEVYMVSNLKGWVVSGDSLLVGCKSIFIQCFFAIANASLCVSKCNFSESGSPRKHCIGSRSW